MRAHRPLRPPGIRLAALAVAACTGMSVLTGCASARAGGIAGANVDRGGTFFGAPTGIGDGTARAYVTLDADGRPTDAGIRMTAAALDGLPDAPMNEFPLALPAQGASTIFEAVVVDWNPHGHGPAALFGKPHFDMHFYLIDEAARAEITPARMDFIPRASNLPPVQKMPAGYSPPAGPAVLNTATGMGVHWTNDADHMVPGEYDFTETFLAGSWDGAYTFMEPMMTRAWLMTKPTVHKKISQPESYPKPGRYPTAYSVTYDDATAEYVIDLGEMAARPGP
ncbi:DUF5602 domain-containing protein [Rhodococcus kronopolitis]|uniref:DUF5602 domain-containing protein n=1 Tax=Rhodococcus kronopolitis TaxID=1460226 RepID=A0ABV9FVQ6_9NOCA